MKQLLEDIKTGQFRQAYLLYGQEAYLRSQYRDRLKNAMTQEGDTMNFSSFQGKDINPAQIIDLAETMPFFAERRVILIQDSGWFKKGGEALADYLKSPAPTAFFIFAEAEIDKRSRLFKAVKETGCAVEFSTQDETTLKRWILGRIKKENKTISQAGLELFLQKTGSDMENIDRELEKLFCYTLPKDAITEADIEAVCTQQMSGKIFDMIEAVAAGKQQEALQLYYDLLALKEPPMRILFLLTRQYRLLFHVKSLVQQGYGRKEIASRAGLHPFVVGKYMDQSKRFRLGELRSVMEEGARIEQDVKTGLLSDSLAVELFIVKYSAKS